jgi:DNA ligase-1
LTPQLKYHVYDIVDDGTLPFNRRMVVLEALVKELKHPSVVLAPTHRVADDADVAQWHAEFVKQGYEGAIIRTSNGKYKAGHRSKDLLKLKSFVDAEFKICDVEDGVGKDAGLAIFVCVTKEGNEFRARPEGTVEARAQMFKDRKKLVNKLLVVRYQNMSDDLVPRFPIGVVIRDYE